MLIRTDKAYMINRQFTKFLFSCTVIFSSMVFSANAFAIDCSTQADTNQTASNAINGVSGFGDGGHPKEHIINSGQTRDVNGTTAFSSTGKAVLFLKKWGENGRNHLNVTGGNLTMAAPIAGSGVMLSPEVYNGGWQNMANAQYVRIVWRINNMGQCELVTMFPSATAGPGVIGNW